MIINTGLTDLGSIRGQALNSLYEIFDNLAEGAFVVDREAKIVWANDRYLAFLGMTERPNVIGKHIADVVPTSLMPYVVETGKSIPFDIIDVNNNWAVVSRFPIKDKNDRILGGFCFVLFDNLEPVRPIVARMNNLRDELTVTKSKLEKVRRSKYNFSQFIGSSAGALEVKRQARRAAASDSTVLLLGETGTGKELIAQAMHAASLRAAHNFVGINMAAIPEDLMEAEFFGTAAGAYTGAAPKGRVGKMALANGGTLFLDEIADMPMRIQVKLLRALQEREIEPVGSNSVVPLNIRLIAATSKDLAKLVKKNEFRADLYYRLNVLPITIPPLRERVDDIPLLAEALMEDICKGLNIPPKEMDADAVRLLQSCPWMGNVRELRNALERVCVLNAQLLLTSSDIAKVIGSTELHNRTSDKGRSQSNLHSSVVHLEKEMITDALERADGNKLWAAKILGISRSNLYKKLEQYDLL